MNSLNANAPHSLLSECNKFLIIQQSEELDLKDKSVLESTQTFKNWNYALNTEKIVGTVVVISIIIAMIVSAIDPNVYQACHSALNKLPIGTIVAGTLGLLVISLFIGIKSHQHYQAATQSLIQKQSDRAGYVAKEQILQKVLQTFDPGLWNKETNNSILLPQSVDNNSSLAHIATLSDQCVEFQYSYDFNFQVGNKANALEKLGFTIDHPNNDQNLTRASKVNAETNEVITLLYHHSSRTMKVSRSLFNDAADAIQKFDAQFEVEGIDSSVLVNILNTKSISHIQKHHQLNVEIQYTNSLDMISSYKRLKAAGFTMCQISQDATISLVYPKMSSKTFSSQQFFIWKQMKTNSSQSVCLSYHYLSKQAHLFIMKTANIRALEQNQTITQISKD